MKVWNEKSHKNFIEVGYTYYQIPYSYGGNKFLFDSTELRARVDKVDIR